MNRAELLRLLAQELRKHLVALAPLPSGERPLADLKRCLHAVRGSAALAGEETLARTMALLEKRLRADDERVPAEARDAIERALVSIDRALASEAAGSPIPAQVIVENAWPIPPRELVPSEIDAELRGEYEAELLDRLAGIEQAVLREGDEEGRFSDLYRHVHTIKGAASAVGDEPTAWFCHGLEAELRAAYDDPLKKKTALSHALSHRTTIHGLFTDPAGTLRALRSRVEWQGDRRDSEDVNATVSPATSIRVQSGALDAILERTSAWVHLSDSLQAHVAEVGDSVRTLRSLSEDAAVALRLIGPPRPWGTPEVAIHKLANVRGSLAMAAQVLDASVVRVAREEHAIGEIAEQVTRELSLMRQTPLRNVFSRMTQTVMHEAQNEGKQVRVLTHGADELVDRHLSERLVEPLLHIARNAVAHGVEPPLDRERVGKPRTATITFRARRLVGRLLIDIEDDGPGLDVQRVLDRAVSDGVVKEDEAPLMDERGILSLLLLPGFSTRPGADTLAGRGFGLDIVASAVRRLGGSVRLETSEGRGFRTSLTLPFEGGLAGLLWVSSGKTEYGIPSELVRRARFTDEEAPQVSLRKCLGIRDRDPTVGEGRALDLDLGDGRNFSLGVDTIGEMERVIIRRVDAFVSALGPFLGAVLRPSGQLCFVLDVNEIASRTER
ncbi:MAG: Hpt domain-containing protein [Polyangiaceae bacterium]